MSRGWKEAPRPSVPVRGGYRDRWRGRLGQDTGWLWGRAEGKVAGQERDWQGERREGPQVFGRQPPGPVSRPQHCEEGAGGDLAAPSAGLGSPGRLILDGTCGKGHCSRGLRRCPMKSRHGPRTAGCPGGPWRDLGESPCPHQHPGRSYGQGPPPDGKACPLGGFGTLAQEARPLSWGH